MPADIYDNMVSVRTDSHGEAWHGLGGFVGEQTAGKTMDKYPNGIPHYEKRLLYMPDDLGEAMTPTNSYGLVRCATKSFPSEMIGTCAKEYNLVQPVDLAAAFDGNVGVPIETLGFLSGGKYMFLTWQLPMGKVVVGKDDESTVFGTVMAGFDGKVAVSLSTLFFRVVCQNTFNMAQNVLRDGDAKKDGRGRVWVGHHNSKNILRDLSAWMRHVQGDAEKDAGLAQSLFNRLLDTPVNSEAVLQSLLLQIYPDPQPIPVYFPSDLRQEKEEKVEIARAKADVDRKAISALFNGGDKTTFSTGDNYWKLFNNVTNYENHVRPSKKDTANSIVFGNRSKQMNLALSVLNSQTN